MQFALYASVLGASLLGSLHCAGMCGGLVAFATASPSSERNDGPRRLPTWRPSWLSHVSYHLGRLGGYVALGAVAGGLGNAMNLAGSQAGLSNVAAIVAAVTILAWAAFTLTGVRLGPRSSALLGRMFPSALSRLRDLPGHQRGIAIGLVTGLLPCGWLYAFVVSAAGTGSIVGGALLMTAFWLGSVPALVGVGGLAQLLSSKLRRRLPAFSALVLLFLGVMNLWTRYSNPAQLSDVARASAAEDHSGPSVTSTALDDVPAMPSCH